MSRLGEVAQNILGKHVSKKIVVFESDDWGSIRMPSVKVYEELMSLGIPLDKDSFCKYDTLESSDDLSLLFDLLSSFKGGDGKHPVFTANSVVANPDFDSIRQSGFQKYYHETINETYSRYFSQNNVLTLCREGIEQSLFKPQFHGREHINYVAWLDLLKSGDKNTLAGFERGVIGHSPGKKGRLEDVMATLDGNPSEHLQRWDQDLEEGLQLFEQIWGYRSKSFIAPCYRWHSSIESSLHKYGVKYIQGLALQQEWKNEKDHRLKFHWLGQKNYCDMQYLVRNCFFEPAIYPYIDITSLCLKRMNIAFKLGKPAVICTHRLNYTGGLLVKNRNHGLYELKRLLRSVVKRWPDVVFLSSDQLGDIISRERQ
jgi:hypothetical protein